jgi:hypothetical protein
LLSKNKKLSHYVFIPLKIEGVKFLHEKCCREETKRDRARLKRIKMIIINFPVVKMEIAASYDESVNDDSLGLTHILMQGAGRYE